VFVPSAPSRQQDGFEFGWLKHYFRQPLYFHRAAAQAAFGFADVVVPVLSGSSAGGALGVGGTSGCFGVAIATICVITLVWTRAMAGPAFVATCTANAHESACKHHGTTTTENTHVVHNVARRLFGDGAGFFAQSCGATLSHHSDIIHKTINLRLV
jgi:hypothetical protein